MAIAQSVLADIDGDGTKETIEGTEDGQTLVIKDHATIWDGQNPIDGWQRRPWDLFLVVDIDNDGKEEILLANNRDGWTGVMKWDGKAMHIVWATASPIRGPAGEWNRRASDEFATAKWHGAPAVAVMHPAPDEWHGILAWQGGQLQTVQITKGPAPKLDAPTITLLSTTETSVTVDWSWQQPGDYDINADTAGFEIQCTWFVTVVFDKQVGAMPPFQITVEGLDPGTPYSVAVMKRQYDQTHSSSDWASAEVTTKSPDPPPPPRLVVVPAFKGLTMDKVLRVLATVGLQQGGLWNPSGEIRDAYLQVVSQTVDPGSRVPAGTRIGFAVTAIAQPIQGFSKIVLSNQNQDNRVVEVFQTDVAVGAAADMGKIGMGASLTLTLADGHVYEVVAVDIGMVNCLGLTPSDVNCQRLLFFADGLAKGPIVPVVIN